MGITFGGCVERLVGSETIGGGPAALGLDQLGPRELDAPLGLGDGRLDLEASQARLGRIGAPLLRLVACGSRLGLRGLRDGF